MPTHTPLAEYLRAATPAERERTAALAGTSEGYLYQLAGCHRKNPGVTTAMSVADATEKVAAESEGRLKPVTLMQLATMCVADDFDQSA